MTMHQPTQISPHETRSGTILRHVQAFLRETGTSVWTYAQTVVDAYHGRVPESHRTVEFREHKPGSDAYRVQKANAGHMTRLLDGTTRLPVDLEESLILAMPCAERQRACWVELAARVGRMSIAHPEDGVRGATWARC